MKKNTTTILLFVVMFVGLFLLLYPPLSDYYNSFHQSRAIAGYVERVDTEEDARYDHLWQAAILYNEQLARYDTVTRLTGAMTLDCAPYSEQLIMDSSQVMGVIEIPQIAVQLPLYHGTSDVVLQVAVGHLEGTSLPTGTLGTHSAFSAHRGLPSAKLFTNLDEVQLGDVFVLRILDQVFTYEVDQILRVLPHQVESLAIDPNMDYCSLITCTPYGINSHRLIVRGHRVENSNAAQAARVTADAQEIDPLIVTPIVAAPMLLVLLIAMLISTSPAKKKKKAALKHFSAEDIVAAADAIKPQHKEKGGERP